MKKFTPTKGIIVVYSLLVVFILVIISIPWCLLGVHPFTISLTVGLGLIIVILIPISIKLSFNVGSIVIKDEKVFFWETTIIDKKVGFNLENIEIGKIKDIKVLDRKEIKSYDNNCKALKVLLFDFGKGDYKYINVVFFSKTQIQEIIDTINEKRSFLI